MNLRFATRGGGDTLVHLTVLETLHFGNCARLRGEALCRPRSSLPNLETLPQQTLGARRCCRQCIAVLARLRLRRRIALPPSAGVLASELVRLLDDERRGARRRPRRPATSFIEGGG
jgi:hypothetical protein